MSSYYTPRKVVIGRYWKRPKPKIYECNLRDAERFYQDSYRDYLQNKEFALRRDSETRESTYSIQRSNSLQQSRSELSASRDCTDSSSRYGEEAQKVGTSYRSSSVTNSRDSPEGELASIEQRLQRLRKLREELGLPSETNTTASYKSSASSSSRVSARQTSPIESRTTESSYSSARASGRSRRAGSETYKERYSSRDATDTSSDRYGGDKSTNYSSSYASSSKEDSYKPSSKSVSFDSKDDYGVTKRYNKYEDDSPYVPAEASSSYKSSSKSFSSGRKGNTSMDDYSLGEYDDEDFVSNLKKKFVSSNDILERIKKMNEDI